MTRYPYKVITFDTKGWLGGKIDAGDVEAQLNRHGADGWELIKVVPILKEMGHTALLVATMKRPVQ